MSDDLEGRRVSKFLRAGADTVWSKSCLPTPEEIKSSLDALTRSRLDSPEPASEFSVSESSHIDGYSTEHSEIISCLADSGCTESVGLSVDVHEDPLPTKSNRFCPGETALLLMREALTQLSTNTFEFTANNNNPTKWREDQLFHILVIEDSVAQRKMIVRKVHDFFTHYGLGLFEIITAEDGEEAMEIIQTAGYNF